MPPSSSRGYPRRNILILAVPALPALTAVACGEPGFGSALPFLLPGAELIGFVGVEPVLTQSRGVWEP